MVIAVRTEEVDGDLVVVKEARTDGDVARLGREATMLDRGRHPGVVELLAVDDRSIRLRHGGTALSRLGPLPLDQAAGVVSAVADTVEALHRQGIVHGDLDGSHVVVDARGRPRLCGFGRASEHTPEGAADDVAALGRLLSSLVRVGEGLPWATPPAGLRARSRRREARRELEAVAARAVRADPLQRPSARQLAKAVHAAVPGQSLPTPAGDARPLASTFAEIPADIDPTADLAWSADDLSFLATHSGDESDEDLDSVAGPSAEPGVERARISVELEPPRPSGPTVALPAQGQGARAGHERPRPTLRTAALALVLLLGVVGGVLGARALAPFGGDGDTTPTDRSTEASPTSASTTASDTAASAPTWPDRCEVPEPPGPDVDGDGCPDAIALDGRRARVRTATVTLGSEGDLVALGDWDCDGVATPALLRPSTGEVFVFPRWTFDEPQEVTATTVVPDASDISAGEGRCPDAVVATPDGPVTVSG